MDKNNITPAQKWLQDHKACSTGISWFDKQDEQDGLAIVQKLIDQKKYSWASWVIVNLMSDNLKDGYSMYVSYAVRAAELSLKIFEFAYIKNSNPRKAIEAAKYCTSKSSDSNKNEARKAAKLAAVAAISAGIPVFAADSAAHAAYCAASELPGMAARAFDDAMTALELTVIEAKSIAYQARKQADKDIKAAILEKNRIIAEHPNDLAVVQSANDLLEATIKQATEYVKVCNEEAQVCTDMLRNFCTSVPQYGIDLLKKSIGK